jgi:hypothetical protein
LPHAHTGISDALSVCRESRSGALFILFSPSPAIKPHKPTRLFALPRMRGPRATCTMTEPFARSPIIANSEVLNEAVSPNSALGCLQEDGAVEYFRATIATLFNESDQVSEDDQVSR